jgi:hypothetical protein
MENKIEVGQRFGKLVVLSCHKSLSKQNYCLCKCDCGAKGFAAYYDKLLNGETYCCAKCKRISVTRNKEEKTARKSKEPNPLIKHPLHRVWGGMIARCENPKRPYYYLYGGRGIKVCKEWRYDYMSFYRWSMGNGYKFEMMDCHRNRYTLDRIDINGDYSPENCRWIDYREQNENKRHNLSLTLNGETKRIKEWLQQFNATVPYFYALLREGKNEKEAIEFIMKI